MPRKKPVDPCKVLESTARRVQQEADEAESVAAGARLREQVMTTLSSHYHSQQQKQTQRHKAVTDQQQAQPQPARHSQHDHSTPQRVDHQQQPGDSTTMLSDKGSRFDRPSLREQQAGHLLRSVPARLAAAMSLVPHFCCSTCLLQSASSDAISAAVQLSVQDWTQLYVAVIYELGILLDMVERQERAQRHQQQRQQQLLQAQQQHHQQQPKSSVCDTEGAGKKSSSDHLQQQQSCLTAEQLELPNSSSGDLLASGGGTNSTPALTATAGATSTDESAQDFKCKGCGQPLPHQAVNPDPAADTPAAAAAAAGGADSDLVTLLQVVEQLMGLVFLAGAVSPGQLLPAISLNHRTQKPQPAPDSYWEVVVERLSLSRDQARYLGACGAEVLRLLRSQSAALHRLTALASGHSLLVLAAEGQPEQQQQQQQEQVQQQQQEWRLLLRDLQRAEKEAGQALQSNAANRQPPQQQQPQQRQQQLDESILEGGADAATAVVDAMDTRVSQLPLFCFLLSYMLYDCLTPVQRAKCMVACYPWSLQPIPITLAAGELHTQLQQAAQEGPQQPIPEQQRKHQQQHRQQWWCERLGELSLTTEEASAVAAAAGLEDAGAAMDA